MMYRKKQALNTDRAKSRGTDLPGVLWMQGAESCSLAVIAITLEHILARQGYAVTLLDQDQINSGLCRDLSQSAEHRHEYARRVAETAKLFAQSGVLSIVMVDPLHKSEQQAVRDILSTVAFSHVYMQSSLDELLVSDGQSNEACSLENDAGTAIIPEATELVISSSTRRSEDVINVLLEHLDARGSLAHGYSALAGARKAVNPESSDDTPISIAAG